MYILKHFIWTVYAFWWSRDAWIYEDSRSNRHREHTWEIEKLQFMGKGQWDYLSHKHICIVCLSSQLSFNVYACIIGLRKWWVPFVCILSYQSHLHSFFLCTVSSNCCLTFNTVTHATHVAFFLSFSYKGVGGIHNYYFDGTVFYVLYHNLQWPKHGATPIY